MISHEKKKDFALGVFSFPFREVGTCDWTEIKFHTVLLCLCELFLWDEHGIWQRGRI